jgi:hypothetical protein
MGVGHLNIGEGIGDAKVFNPMPAIQQYGQILAQKQAKHEAEVRALGDELAKGYDPNGLRNDADKLEYAKRYKGIKEDAIAAENEKDATKKAMALSGIRQRLTDLSAFSTGSKTLDKFEREAAKEHALHPYVYDDSTSKKLLDQRNRTWDHPDNVKDWSGIERGVDPAKEEVKYDKWRDEVLKHHPATYGTEKISYGQNVFGRKTATGTQERVIPYQDALEMHLHAATADMDYQKHLQNKYPELQDPNPQKQLAMRVAQDMKDHGDGDGIHDRPKVKNYEDVAPDKFYEHYNYELNHPKVSPTTAQSNTPTYRQDLVGRILSGSAGSGEELKAKIAADPAYDGELKIGGGTGKAVKGHLLFTIPPKRVWKQKTATDDAGWYQTAPQREIWIDPSAPNAKIKLNEMINELTGEKVDISALQTPGGKKHIGVGQHMQGAKTTPDDFNKQWSKLPKGATLVGPDGVTYTKK